MQSKCTFLFQNRPKHTYMHTLIAKIFPGVIPPDPRYKEEGGEGTEGRGGGKGRDGEEREWRSEREGREVMGGKGRKGGRGKAEEGP